MYPFSAVELARQIKAGKIGVLELVRYYLARIARYDGPKGLNAVACLVADVEEQAAAMDRIKDKQDPLFGLPVLVKDNIDVRGLPTTSGSLALKDNLASQDAAVVTSLRQNGALILGKTNMTELANYMATKMPNGFSSLAGQVQNAYGSQFNPGGSSSGSGVAMAAGFCALALGTDTSFSIIDCAAKTGVTGFKPPAGLLPADGIIPIARTLDTAGPMSFDLADSLLAYSCLQPGLPKALKALDPARMRLAVNVYREESLAADQKTRYKELLKELAAAGARLGQVNQPGTSLITEIMRGEFPQHLADYLAGAQTAYKSLAQLVRFYEKTPKARPFGMDVLEEALAGATSFPSPAYQAALARRQGMRGQIAAQLQDYDACLMTGTSNIMHFLGLPAVTLKLGMAADGSPRGLVLYGTDEKRLLSAALAVEKFCRPVTPPLA